MMLAMSETLEQRTKLYQKFYFNLSNRSFYEQGHCYLCLRTFKGDAESDDYLLTKVIGVAVKARHCSIRVAVPKMMQTETQERKEWISPFSKYR